MENIPKNSKKRTHSQFEKSHQSESETVDYSKQNAILKELNLER